MDEVDSILIYTLNRIGCEVGDGPIRSLSPHQIIRAVQRCFELIRPDLQFQTFESNVSMSGRYKQASQIAQAVTDLGYSDEVGCQSFLYPTESDTRKLLIFMMEKLPKDYSDSQVENLLERIAKEAQANQQFDEQSQNQLKFNGSSEVGGIRLPGAVDVNSLPKETLRFYASHLADLTFPKSFKKSGPPEPKVVPVVQHQPSSDDDFGDPDVEIEIPQPLPLPEENKPKPTIPPKPKPPKPKLKPKPQKSVSKDKDQENEAAEEEKLAQEVRDKINYLQEDIASKAKSLVDSEQELKSINGNLESFQEQINSLKSQISDSERELERRRKAWILISQNSEEDGLLKVQSAINTQTQKLLTLAQQWEKHRKPLVEEIRAKRNSMYANNSADGTNSIEEIKKLKVKLKEMGQEAKSKEEIYEGLKVEYEKMQKDLNRSAYTKRISEIIGNIKKQKKEITKVLKDTREIQKEINSLSGRLDRTFAVADELIFQDAEKDKSVASSYKLLVSIHSEFSRLIKILETIGNSKRLARDLDDKLESERTKNVQGKLESLKADIRQMKTENQILEAKLRDPAFQKLGLQNGESK